VLAPQQPAPEPAAASPAGGSTTSGVDYLRRKREAATRRRTLVEDATRAAHDLHEVAARRAVASRRLAPQDPRLTGRTDTMVLNAAYLVEEDEHASFRSAVLDAAEQQEHVSVELDGPWPPYSFAVLG